MTSIRMSDTTSSVREVYRKHRSTQDLLTPQITTTINMLSRDLAVTTAAEATTYNYVLVTVHPHASQIVTWLRKQVFSGRL